MAYTPLELGGEDYFAEAFKIVNEEIDRAVRKSAKAFAQKAVTSFGQMPYGSSATQSIIGDIFGGGVKAKGRAYADIGLGAAIPQFQAQFQAGEAEKQRGWSAEQAELDRQFREEMLGRGYEYETEKARAGKKTLWDYIAEVAPYALFYL